MPIDATPRNAAHLWRRAAFGASPEQIDQTVRDGIEATVASMFDHRRARDAGKPYRSIGFNPFESDALNAWFVDLAATSPTPVIERLMWFWHGHFATNIDKFEGPEIFHAQLMTFRRHGMGRFDDLLKLVSRDPAMILWLDLHLSVRIVSSCLAAARLSRSGRRIRRNLHGSSTRTLKRWAVGRNPVVPGTG